MKIVAAVLLAFVVHGVAPAQDKSNQLAPNVRLYEPKNLSPGRAVQVAQFVNSLLSTGTNTPQVKQAEGQRYFVSVDGLRINWEEVPHAIVIRGGSAADQDAAEVLLKRFDVPERPSQEGPLRRLSSTFEITAYLIRADSAEPPSTATPGRAVPALMPVPKDLQSAVDEMKQTFTYHDYHLWDVILLQATGSKTDVSGLLPMKTLGMSPPPSYSLTFSQANTQDDKTIYLSGFEFLLKQPWGNAEPLQSRIAHTVVLQVGQKLVLGKIRLLPGENADLFLVLTARTK